MTNPRQRELDRLRLVLLTFCEFYRTTELGPYVDTMIDGIEQAYRDDNVRGMRAALADGVERLQDASGEELRALDTLLRERVGIRLDDLQQRRLARLASVRDRGQITTEAQCRLVLARVDEVYADPNRADEVAEWNRLLAEYESRPHRASRASNRR